MSGNKNKSGNKGGKKKTHDVGAPLSKNLNDRKGRLLNDGRAKGKKGHYSPKDRSGTKGKVKDARLPTSGKFRYLPPKNLPPNSPLPKNSAGEYIDRYGNRWQKGPSRTGGDDFEWDVQINPKNEGQIGGFSSDKKKKDRHINVSLDGHVTH